MLGRAVRAVRRRASFSVRFAIILAVLGALIAGATAAIPLELARDQTRAVALDRAAGRAAVAVNLIGTQRSTLQSYVAGVAAQVAAPLAASDRTTAVQILVRQSRAMAGNDVLGIDGGPVLRGGVDLPPDDTARAALLAAADAGGRFAVQGNGMPWLVETAAVPTLTSVRLLVGRPLDGGFVGDLAAVLDGGAEAAHIAVLHDNFYVSGSTVTGGGVPHGAPLPDAYAIAQRNLGGAVEVHADGADQAVSMVRLDPDVALLVTTGVVAGSGSVAGTVIGPVALIAVAMILLAMIVVFVVVQRDLQRPLHRLARAVDGMEREDFDVPIPSGEDELGRLAESFDRMRQALRATLSGAEARATLASELNAAQPLQTALQKVCDLLRDTTAARVALIVVDHSDMADAFATASGTDAEVAADWLLGGGGPINAAVAAAGGGILQATALPGTGEAALGLRQVCAAPLRMGGNVLGAVALADKEAGFTAADIDLVGAAAEQVVLALERYRILAVAQRQASTDELTGLYNYRFLVDYLDQQIALAERLGTPLAVLMLDLDRFKSLNDTYGHHAGDEALRAFSDALLSTVRRADLAARYGGEEFVVVMANTNRDDARLVAEKIRRAVADVEMRFSGTLVRVTVSIGGVAYPDDTGDARQMLRLADEALYRAKRGGRDRVCFVNDPGRRRTLARTGAEQSGQHEGEDEHTGRRSAQ